jgi:hypothetical protein
MCGQYIYTDRALKALGTGREKSRLMSLHALNSRSPRERIGSRSGNRPAGRGEARRTSVRSRSPIKRRAQVLNRIERRRAS